jgi:hypothetical protein
MLRRERLEELVWGKTNSRRLLTTSLSRYRPALNLSLRFFEITKGIRIPEKFYRTGSGSDPDASLNSAGA